MGFPNRGEGEGGSPTREKFPHFPVFFLLTSLTSFIVSNGFEIALVYLFFYLPSPKKYLATEPFKIWTQVWEFWIHFDRVTIYGRTTVRRKLEISLLQPLVVHHGQSLREMGKTGAMFIENMGKTTGKSNFIMDNSTDKQNIMKLLTQNTNAAFNSANKPNQSRDCLLIYICKYKGSLHRKFHMKSVVFCRTSLYNILYFLN